MLEQGLVQLCEAGARYDTFGWMLATAGNLSLRDPAEPAHYHITASGLAKGRLRADTDFIRMRQGLERVHEQGAKYSAETIVHDRLYQMVANAKSIHHVHAPYLTLLSRQVGAGRSWEIRGLEYIKALGFWDEGASVAVQVVANAAHIPDLAELVVDAAQKDARVPCVLVEGHGVYAWGDSVFAAQRHTEAIEFLAHMAWEESR